MVAGAVQLSPPPHPQPQNEGDPPAAPFEQLPGTVEDVESAVAISKATDRPKYLIAYLRKFKAGKDPDLLSSRPPLFEIVFAWFGALLAIMAVAGISVHTTSNIGLPILVPSLGASSVLIFGASDNKLSQPRNVVVGHVSQAG